jgi:opacity protein-like surface antigen
MSFPGKDDGYLLVDAIAALLIASVAAAAVLAAAVAAVLVLPVRLEAGLAGDGRPRWRAEASALGGLVRLGRDYEGRYWACGPFRRALGPPAAKAENGQIGRAHV